MSATLHGLPAAPAGPMSDRDLEFARASGDDLTLCGLEHGGISGRLATYEFHRVTCARCRESDGVPEAEETCDRCGAPGPLHTVTDEDPAVGYCAELSLCESCERRKA